MPGERGYLFFTTYKGSLWASNILGHFIHVKFFPEDSEKVMRGCFFFFQSPHKIDRETRWKTQSPNDKEVNSTRSYNNAEYVHI